MLTGFKKVITALLISIFVIFLRTLDLSLLNELDRLFYQVKFKLRGEGQIDSSIIFLYVDDAEIHSLGGYPLKRTYWALLVKILTELDVKVIGLDLIIAEKNPDYPERDAILVSTIKESKRVCLAGSFSEIEGKFNGKGLIKPFDELLGSAKGFGHLNYISNGFPSKIPLFISSEDEPIPSFSLELARLYYGIEKSSIKVFNDKVLLGNIEIPLNDGCMLINYCGGTKSLQMYSVAEFISSYDAFKFGGEAKIDFKKFKDKIVLIGIYSENLGQVVQTPFDDKFPATGVHAMALDTILRRKFLTELSPPFEFVLIFLSTALVIYTFFSEKISPLKKIVLSLLTILIFLTITIILFTLGLSISIYPILSLAGAFSTGLIYILEVQRRKTVELELERGRIEELIREKELLISELKNKIENLEGEDEKSKAMSNLENVYSQVRELTSRFEDLSAFEIAREEKVENFEGIIYIDGGKMSEVISTIKKIAQSDVPVLITGENGVGKELVAMAIHRTSDRRDKKFIAVNCSAIPETLLESELFGYEKGAFTGAFQRKKGIFETADGGTIFLDEIAETSEQFQTKILRIVQSGEFNRVGGREILKVNVRIIAATNKDLERAVKEGKFREDLYYRLNVIRIHIPPLRERKEDIPALVEHFLKKFKAEDMRVSTAVMEAFLNYDWPGNVRQLESTIRRGIIFAKSEGRNLIQLKDIPDEIINFVRGKMDIEGQILNLLREKKFSHSSISETANELGLNRGTVAEYLRGICFRYLYESNFDIDKASREIAGNDKESIERVKKKILEHLENFFEILSASGQNLEIKALIKSKYKNLPSRYHLYLEQTARRYLSGEMLGNLKPSVSKGKPSI
jgi:transcriptional regulator with GAF, ATPase, and Fis domain/CHASE2 domain-containing sensor protein